ncbi:MAG: RlmE family RNA methyltransferase [Deltaproteobacteria bacterium]|nr:RlmE family RNA methyltransferase [Deltaproteobacteria bacterium]
MATYERKDRFYHQAKARGLPSRAGFKIEEMILRHRLVRAGDAVLDLGAAPGGWAVVLAKAVGPRGLVLAIDLEPLAKGAPNLRAFRGDIHGEAAASWMGEQLEGRKVQAVCSDMSPKLTGIFFKDAYLSYELGVKALEVAQRWLQAGGNFVAKLFPGEEFPEYLKKLRNHFKTVKVFEPEATRKTSREVYVLGLGWKG